MFMKAVKDRLVQTPHITKLVFKALSKGWDTWEWNKLQASIFICFVSYADLCYEAGLMN